MIYHQQVGDPAAAKESALKEKVLLDLDFGSLPSEDIKAGGDGIYSFNGTPFDITNAPASQQMEIINGTGLQMECDAGQLMDPASNISLAPQLRVLLSTLLSGHKVSETDRLAIWCRLEVANMSSITESCGIGLVSAGNTPATFISLARRSDGMYSYRHSNSNNAASGTVSADSSKDILIIEKPHGINLWILRTGSWSSGWPDISSTDIIGFFYLKVPDLNIANGLDVPRYSSTELVLFNENNANASATGYGHALSVGDRTASMAVSSDASLSGSPIDWVNGDKVSLNQVAFFNASIVGKFVKFDFLTDLVCDEVTFIQVNASQTHGTWRWEGSNNNSDWDILSADFVLDSGAGGGNVVGDLSANLTPYRYLRAFGISGQGNGSFWTQEFEFSLGVTPPTTDYDIVSTFKNLKVESS